MSSAAIMTPAQPVRITVYDNTARIEPIDQVGHVVANHAVFYRKVYSPGGRGERRKFESVRTPLYMLMDDPSTGEQYYLTYAGLVQRLARQMQVEGMELSMAVLPRQLPVYEPDFTWVKRNNIKLRGGQLRMLEAILKYDRGQLVGPPALGKTFLIRVVTHMYPQPECRIVIAVPALGLLHAYLRELRPDFPLGEVGQLGGSRRETKARIIVSTFDSLEHVEAEKTDLLFVDEVHECGTDNRTSVLSRFTRSRMFGLTASAECRTDKSDLQVEALFGQPIVQVGYDEAVQEGYIPEIDAYFYRCRSLPSQAMTQATRERMLVWKNRFRNETIAGVCRYWERALAGDDGYEPQILVLVSTLEHMFTLQQMHLPDYTMIYDGISLKLRMRLIRDGIIRREHRNPGLREKLEQLHGLTNGSIRKAIVQSRAGTGTDTKHLDVVVRADGKSSEIGNIQYRGRVMRGLRGIYADILDVGDPQQEAAARKRYRSAERYGMKPKVVDLWDSHRILSSPRGA